MASIISAAHRQSERSRKWYQVNGKKEENKRKKAGNTASATPSSSSISSSSSSLACPRGDYKDSQSSFDETVNMDILPPDELLRTQWRSNAAAQHTAVIDSPEDKTAVTEAQLRQKSLTQAREFERQQSAADDLKERKEAAAAKRRAVQDSTADPSGFTRAHSMIESTCLE